MPLPEYQVLAVAFATALVGRDFVGAARMLGTPISASMTAINLEHAFESMCPAQPSAATPQVRFDSEFTHEDWPAKRPKDVGWVYIGIEGDGFVEAISVIIAKQDGRLVIRDLEWGRP